MIYCGIDPGNSGAIAIFGMNRLVYFYDMPTEPKLTGKGLQVSASGLYNILRKWNLKVAYVEKVHAMPGQGVTSMFTFGRGLGVIEGVLAGLEIEMAVVPPRKWKDHFGLIGKEKNDARVLSLAIYPDFSQELKLKKNIGKADALLIGMCGESERVSQEEG